MELILLKRTRPRIGRSEDANRAQAILELARGKTSLKSYSRIEPALMLIQWKEGLLRIVFRAYSFGTKAGMFSNASPA
jgi:hypothetical protein